MRKYVAVDLGADSGRVVVGDVGDMQEVHRFSNGPVRIGDSIYWDFLSLFSEIKIGLSKAFAEGGDEIASIGIDTWGVDFALLDSDGDLIGNPYHYRDDRTDGITDAVYERISQRRIYEETGIQFMQLNTIFQLYAFSQAKPDLMAVAKHLLTVPALLNYWLTGVMKNEYSHATTTQLYDPRKKSWSTKILAALGISPEIFGDVVMPGSQVGPLLPHVAKEIGATDEVCVVATASHDTASAVAAVPAPVPAPGERGYAYLSSGTWSLLGIESPTPIISDKSLEHNFTNEGAADGGIRFLKNIMGLWILQECKRHWDAEGSSDSYDDLSDQAESCGAAGFRMDVDDPRFLKPSVIDDNMPERIRDYCRETGQKSPAEKGEIVRGIYEGLADKYATTIAKIEEITGTSIDRLYIVGGGSKDRYLSQLAAKTAGIPVSAGPKEATAIGNIVVQAVSMGEVASFDEGRRIVSDSYEIVEYLP